MVENSLESQIDNFLLQENSNKAFEWRIEELFLIRDYEIKTLEQRNDVNNALIKIQLRYQDINGQYYDVS